jgi:proteasome lid subunit RPN8/RPN11
MINETMLILDRELQLAINAHGLESYPYEGCGLMLGSVVNDVNMVQAIYPVQNVWENLEERRVRFRIDVMDFVEAEITAEEHGLDIIGIFHSHPDHQPVASARDLAWATWTGYSYLITEVRDGAPNVSRSWQLLTDRSGFIEEEVRFNDLRDSSAP